MTFTFSPVNVNRGRKFRGFAYIIEGGYTYTRGYAGSGVDPYRETDYCKLWDPVAKRFVYANADFCEEAVVEAMKIDADRKAYVDNTIQSTMSWCRSQKPDAPMAEIQRFARNVLRKHHPEMLEAIDTTCPDNRDVVDEVERTLRWASTLKTRACFMYGRHCPGGKPLSNDRKIKIAKNSLERKGITKLEGFEEAWNFMLEQMQLKK